MKKRKVLIFLFGLAFLLLVPGCDSINTVGIVTGCTVTKLNSTSLYDIVQWDSLSGAKTYELYSYVSKVDFKYRLSKVKSEYSLGSATATIIKNSNVNKGILVVGVNSSGVKSLTSSIATLSSNTSYVGTPTKSGDTLSWKAFPSAISYLVCTSNGYSSDITMNKPTSTRSYLASTNSFDCSGIPSMYRTSYNFRIWAYDGSYYYMISNSISLN